MAPKRLATCLSLVFRLAVLGFLVRAVSSSDEYVNDLHKKCFKTKRPFFCITFRMAKYVESFDYNGPENSVVKLVNINRQQTDLLPSPRFISSDSEWDKFVKFLQRKFVNFISTHGLAFEVPQGVDVVQGRSLNDVADDAGKFTINFQIKNPDVLKIQFCPD